MIFTEEDVEYSPIEESRVRLMYLWWYLSDGTMRILEPSASLKTLIFYPLSPSPLDHH